MTTFLILFRAVDIALSDKQQEFHNMERLHFSSTGGVMQYKRHLFSRSWTPVAAI